MIPDSELANWTDDDIIDLYEQFAATRMECFGSHERGKAEAERKAYFDLRVWIGPKRAVPDYVRQRARIDWKQGELF
jgi:hypothetical protein